MKGILRKKNENLTVRIDAQTRHALDLLARTRRGSISDLVVEQVREVTARELPKVTVQGKRVPLMDAVWDVFPQDRLVKLARVAPQLLNDEEQKLWRVISEDRGYWTKASAPDFWMIRRHWKQIQQKVREYEESVSEVPK